MANAFHVKNPFKICAPGSSGRARFVGHTLAMGFMHGRPCHTHIYYEASSTNYRRQSGASTPPSAPQRWRVDCIKNVLHGPTKPTWKMTMETTTAIIWLNAIRCWMVGWFIFIFIQRAHWKHQANYGALACVYYSDCIIPTNKNPVCSNTGHVSEYRDFWLRQCRYIRNDFSLGLEMIQIRTYCRSLATIVRE